MYLQHITGNAGLWTNSSFFSLSPLSLSVFDTLSIPLKNSLTDLNKIQFLTQLNKKK